MKRNYVFIKHGDCIREYGKIYQFVSGNIYDGEKPYLEEIVDFFRGKMTHNITIVSLGSRNEWTQPENNIELKVIDQFAENKIIRIFKFLKMQGALFFYLSKRSPQLIIYMADLRFLHSTMIYSLLKRKKVILFLTASIEKYHLMNQLIVTFEELFSKIISRNRKNIDILRNLGCTKRCDLCYPRYSDFGNSKTVPTILREDPNFKILFIGRLAYVKGVDVLREVVLKARDKDISFYVIGNGPYYKQLESFKKQNQIKHMHLLGYIPNKRIYSFVNDSDVGLIPSRSEGVCKVALEFMLMKTPVVASNVAGIREIVSDGVNGLLVEPDDVKGFLNKIELLKCDRSLYFSLSTGAEETKSKILRFDKDFQYYLGKIF